MDVSIIIVNWNSRDDLQKCISSIFKHTREVSYEIVVIDAASYDGSDMLLREEFPDVRFIQCADNKGFATSNNMAYAASRGQWLLFLNPDTEFQCSVVEILYDGARRLPDAGLLGARLLNTDGTLDKCCVQSLPTITNQLMDADALRRSWPNLKLWGNAALFESDSDARKVEAVPGACFMVRRDVFERVGRFSEEYFMYAEDFDLSYKVQRAGYHNYYVPRAIVTHHGGRSSGQSISDFSAVMPKEANWRFLRKTKGPSYAFGYRLSMLAAAVVRIMILAGAIPTAVASVRRRRLSASLKKWKAVLRWTIRTDNVVQKYYPATDVSRMKAE